MAVEPRYPDALSASRVPDKVGSRASSVEMTIILVMAETLPLADVKARFSELADRVEKEHDRIVVTRNGRPAVVLVSPDDLESLEETLSILSNRELTKKIRAGVREIEAGRGVPLEEVLRRRSKT